MTQPVKIQQKFAKKFKPILPKKCLFVLDRGEAIAHALSLSTTADDAIAGKGADLYQKSKRRR